ncbi:MAG TPA: FAD-dependent oxidoreductase, partial [Baekduia sp.]
MSPAARMFVIVGASLAGAKAAETLRTEGFDGRIVLVGSENERPYERPPMSKDYLRGESEREALHVHAPTFYVDHDIPGADLDGVLSLRSVEDCDRLRERLERGGSVVVIGAGWIGAEVAASARQRGLDVTVIARGSVPMERVLGLEVGAIYRDAHLEQGTRLLMETGIAAFEGATAVERVRTTDGRTVDCDFVVAGVGVTPRTGLAEQAGLAVGDGVLVDAHL